MSLASVLAAFGRRNQTQIRDTALSFLKTAYRFFLQKDLDTQEGSDSWLVHGVNALFLEGIQQQAAMNTAQAFVDTATEENVLHHARIEGLVRKPDVDAQLDIVVSGAPGSTWVSGNTLTAADGTLYAVMFGYGGTIPGGGQSTARVQAVRADGNAALTTGLGAQTNKTPGSLLSWESTPSGLNSTVEVSAIARQGADVESLDELAKRCLARRREKPSAFNRAEIRDILERRVGVAQAYVYPAYHFDIDGGDPSTADVGTADESGWTLAFTLAAPPNRMFSAGETTEIDTYLQEQRPAPLLAGRVAVLRPPTVTQDVTTELTLGPEYAFPFAGNYTVDSGSTATVINVTTNPTGVVTIGDLVAVEVGNSVRGHFQVRRVTAVGSGSLSLDAALSLAPSAGAKVYPAPANWEAALAGVLGVFDRLGPGDVTTAGNSYRYPPQSERGPSTLFLSQINAALVRTVGPFGEEVGVDGIIATGVTTPSDDVAAGELELILPGKIIFVAA